MTVTTVYNNSLRALRVQFRHEPDFTGDVFISTWRGTLLEDCINVPFDLLKIFMVAHAIAPGVGAEMEVWLRNNVIRKLADADSAQNAARIVSSNRDHKPMLCPMDALQYIVQLAMQ